MKHVLLIAMALALSGCTLFNKEPPVVLTKTEYVPIKVDPKYTDKDACPKWPLKSDFVKNGLSSEADDYMFAAFKAWSCERKTRMKIKDEEDRIEKDVIARNTAK